MKNSAFLVPVLVFLTVWVAVIALVEVADALLPKTSTTISCTQPKGLHEQWYVTVNGHKVKCTPTTGKFVLKH